MVSDFKGLATIFTICLHSLNAIPVKTGILIYIWNEMTAAI